MLTLWTPARLAGMPTQLPGGGWDLSDEEAAEIGRVSERDAEVRRRSRLVNRPWRIGRHNDRTIYVMSGPEASDGDLFIGTLDTAELVAEAVRAHNYLLEIGRIAMHPVT